MCRLPQLARVSLFSESGSRWMIADQAVQLCGAGGRGELQSLLRPGLRLGLQRVPNWRDYLALPYASMLHFYSGHYRTGARRAVHPAGGAGVYSAALRQQRAGGDGRRHTRPPGAGAHGARGGELQGPMMLGCPAAQAPQGLQCCCCTSGCAARFTSAITPHQHSISLCLWPHGGRRWWVWWWCCGASPARRR